jgi:uncharacterized metal-binding protein YceD (DUF177 family)
MADEADQAAFIEERDRKLALAVRQAELRFTGQCHSCEQPVEAPLQFCDVYCREDHEREQRALKLAGTP